MISLLKGFEIEGKSTLSGMDTTTSTADCSFSMMENTQEGGRISSRTDLAEKLSDLETRVPGIGDRRGFGFPEEPKMDADDAGESITYMDEESRGSSLESIVWMHGLRVGDMVWGKVKSHPWWPGHIFNVAFASLSVRRMRREGHVLVAFFGDSSYGWFDPAELIPFEPHFPEKSRQTTSRNFVRAVDEAVDEASRRASLAFACFCRNLHNFRPTNVPSYFAVDVVGYEPGGIYSSRQIKRSRDNLVPVELVSFIQQLALAPFGNEGNEIEWFQTVAKLLAYRRAVFEEFDETYAQAFGVDPVRPSPNSVAACDQTDRFAPRVVPLTGPLVVAEALGERRSSARQAALQKPINISKKNKYVLKRRDDLPSAVSASASAFASSGSSLPDLPSASQPLPHHGFFPSSPDSAVDSDYELRKRESILLPPPAENPNHLPAPMEDSLPADHSQTSDPAEIKNEPKSSDSIVVAPTQIAQNYTEHDECKRPPVDIVIVSREKIPKRAREDLSELSGDAKGKKKRKKDGLGTDQHPPSFDPDQKQQRRSQAASSNPELLSQEDDISMELPSRLELSSLQLPLLINDLTSIALDPFFAIERHAPAIVRHVFLRFRSLVYQKSLSFPVVSETPADVASSAGRDGREHRESSSKHQKLASRTGGDSIKPARKRDPSDRQEERSAKKMKKIHELKQLTSKKKPAVGQKQQQPKDQKDSTAEAAAALLAKKQEPAPPPKAPSPTYLVMKFPPRSTLPSVSNLNARFVRFGPLDLSGTRVFWKTYTCKVLFKHKPSGQAAYNFVQNNDLFGQVKVVYHLREVEISVPDQQQQTLDPPPSMKPPSDSSRLQKPSSLVSQPRQSHTQLKSILKKSGGDEPSNNNGAASSGREIPRVKFMLNGDDDVGELHSSKAANNGSGLLPYRNVPSNPPQRLLQPSRLGFPPPVEQRDISGPMLSLLLKCNDIVSHLKASLGYLPYHSL